MISGSADQRALKKTAQNQRGSAKRCFSQRALIRADFALLFIKISADQRTLICAVFAPEQHKINQIPTQFSEFFLCNINCADL